MNQNKPIAEIIDLTDEGWVSCHLCGSGVFFVKTIKHMKQWTFSHLVCAGCDNHIPLNIKPIDGPKGEN